MCQFLFCRATSNSVPFPSLIPLTLKSNLRIVSVKKASAPLMYRYVGRADEKYFSQTPPIPFRCSILLCLIREKPNEEFRQITAYRTLRCRC